VRTGLKATALLLLLALAMLATACGGGDDGDDSGDTSQAPAADAGSSGSGSQAAAGSEQAAPSGETVEIEMWHGYGELAAPGEEPNYEYDWLKAAVDAFEASHPGIKVNLTYVNSDVALEKLTVALQGGKAPDITYQYGTNIAQLATSDQTVDLTERVNAPEYDWADFPQGERDAFTVDGKVYGVPALVDNLAVVYNKDLFAKAGLTEPGPDWTWDELVADAKALTNEGDKQFGLEWPIDGSETEVWKYIAMLWEAGGDILTPDGTKTAFASPQGVTALTALQQLGEAKTLLEDPTPDSPKTAQLFNAGKLGMFITGPWQLGDFPDVNYGVQVMPAFPGGSHETIAGPDAWVLLDNGDEKVAAAWTFLQWLTAKEQILQEALATGHLPTRTSVSAMPEFAEFATKYPGVDVFVDNLANVKKARPSIAAYPQISTAIGQAVTSVVLGESTPEEALQSAAKQADAALAG
jgi:multiple sugar transport system substrate-binding protein